MTRHNTGVQPQAELAEKGRKHSKPATKTPRAPVSRTGALQGSESALAQRLDNAIRASHDAIQQASNIGARARERRRDIAGSDAGLLGTLLDDIEEGVAHVATDGLILYANPRFSELVTGDPHRIQADKTHLRDLVSDACWRDLDEGLKLASRQRVSGRLRVEDPQHIVVRTLRLVLTPVFWKSKVTIKLTATEMTELLAKNRELKDKEEALHALSARIMQLQDDERRRIARDLHDITGQELAVVIMLLMQASREIRADTESLKTITDAATMVRKIEDEIRTLSYVLHPPLLDELGLGAALNWYAEGFTKRSGIQVSVDVQKDMPRLSKEKELALFRVVQEALTNVMRHSGSRTAQIQVSANAESATLTIQDEGKGIGRKRFTKSSPKVHGVGIMGMRERLQQLGGGIEVKPLPRGTEVVAVMPIGYAPPVEIPFSDHDILQMAKALGYKEGVNQTSGPAAALPSAAQPSAAPTAPSETSAPALSAAAPSLAAAPTATEAAATALPAAELSPSAASSNKKRILIADDHEVTRYGIRTLLKDEKNIEICGEATNGLEAILKAKKLAPDLIIMDLSMPGGGGFTAANKIRQARMHAKILFFSTHQSHEIERMARIAGFEGLVQKTDAARDLVSGIRAILEGKRFYGARVMTEEEAKRHPHRSGVAGA